MFLAPDASPQPCRSKITSESAWPMWHVKGPPGKKGMGMWAATVLAMAMTSISCPASGSVLPEMQGLTAAGGQQSPVSWAGAEGIRRRHSGRRMRPVIGEHPLRLRGGAGGGRQRMIGGNRKGYMLGLKKTDGLELIREDPMNPPLPRDPDEVAAEDAAYQVMAERHTREAGKIADMTLRHVIGMCVPGAKANDVCRLGDSYMIRRLRERFPGLVAADSFPDTAQFSTKKKAGARTRVTAADLTPKNDTVGVGIGFPTCVGIDNICGKYAPTSKDSLTFRTGQIVHVEVACHVYGFVASVGHTISLSDPSGSELMPKQTNVICAAKAGANVMMRSLVPGAKSNEVIDHVEKAILSLGCRAVDGCMTRRIDRYSSDGTPQAMIPHRIDQVINDNGVIPADCEVEEGDIWCIDVLVTSGDGHARMKNFRNTTIFRRIPENKWIHLLALRYSRDFLNKVISRHPVLPFHMREFPLAEDRAGLGECIKRRLIMPYPVLYERRSELIARVKMTVFVGASGAVPLTRPPDNLQTCLNKVSFEREVSSKAGKEGAEEPFLMSGGQMVAPPVNSVDRVIRWRKMPELELHDGFDDRGADGGDVGDAVDDDGDAMKDEGEEGEGEKGSKGIAKKQGGRSGRGAKVESLHEVLVTIAEGGEEAINRLVPRHRGMRNEKVVKVMCPAPAGGKAEERGFPGGIVRLCEEFIEPRTKAYRFLDGDRSNLSTSNVRWVAAVQVFEAAMLRSEVWETDLELQRRA